MERRGRIPVAKFRTQEGKTRSRSRVREPDYNEQDPETDLFTLLEDNIALKEENKSLKLELENERKEQQQYLEKNLGMRDELNALQKRQLDFEEQIKEISAKYTKTSNERIVLEKMHKLKVEKITSLTQQLQLLQKQSSNAMTSSVVVDSIGLKNKLAEILPVLASNDMESILDIESMGAMPLTTELVERLADEFLTLKNAFNGLELQLYEANEKIAELLENQHHIDEENETLRSENTNLTKVAKLLTENMKESVETSKKMEIALVKLKQRNDELSAKQRNRDVIDGHPAQSPSPTTVKANEEFEQIKEEVHNQNRDHNERVVEMRTLMEAAIQKNTNDELKTLQLKLEILEVELRQAVARAELAECELEKYKTNENLSGTCYVAPLSPPTPPPPPPLPATPLYPTYTTVTATTAAAQAASTSMGGSVRTFGERIAAAHSQQHGSNADKIIGTVMQQVQPEAATGLDALVREFKSGRVTLRRNRRKTHANEALEEMFQVLEISQKQNRNSKICINMHL